MPRQCLAGICLFDVSTKMLEQRPVLVHEESHYNRHELQGLLITNSERQTHFAYEIYFSMKCL